MRVGWPLLPQNRNLTKDVLFGSFPPFLSLNILGIQYSYQLAKCANWGSMNHSLYFKVASIMNREAGTSLFSSLNKQFYKAGTWGSQMRWQGWAPAFNALWANTVDIVWHQFQHSTSTIWCSLQSLAPWRLPIASSGWDSIDLIQNAQKKMPMCVQYTVHSFLPYHLLLLSLASCWWAFIFWGALCTHHLTFWRVFSLVAWWYFQLNGRNS